MCKDSCFIRCFGIRFVEKEPGSYYVLQKQGNSEHRLGSVTRRNKFPYWLFVSFIYPYVSKAGITRIDAVRKSMEEYVVKYPFYKKMPRFINCNCMICKSSGEIPDESSKENSDEN